MTEVTVQFNDQGKIAAVFGNFDIYAEMIERELNVSLLQKQGAISISGESVNCKNAAAVIEFLNKVLDSNGCIIEHNVRYALSMVSDGNLSDLDEFGNDCICITSRGKPIKAKTVGQKHYIDSIKKNTVTFAIGPAGTGKTFLAVAMAVNALRAKEVNRIILTRPAVEAGEKLGFLPGDLQNKIDPYLRPLYDALYELMGHEGFNRNMEKGVIEIAPLAYMRGRTLDDSFIILDEAQNTSPEQMKMFLTRLGFGSKAVVTGDITQVDLPAGHKSGLNEAARILGSINGIAVHRLTGKDIVRHALVQKIIEAYEKYENFKNQNKGNKENDSEK